MGKCRKRVKRSHASGYPYFPVRVTPANVAKPAYKHEEDSSIFLGLFECPPHPLLSGGLKVTTKYRSGLKRLEFVRTYSGYYWNKSVHVAAAVYASTRSCVPGPLDPTLKVLEAKVSQLTTPLLTAVQQRTELVLRDLDDKVDSALVTASDLLWSPVDSMVQAQRVQHQRTVANCKAARHAYLSSIQETVEFLKAQGLTGTARYAAGALLGRVEEATRVPPALEQEAEALVAKVGEAWACLLALPPVHTLLDTAAPSVDYARAKYLTAHDAIVTSTAYNRALEAAAGIMARVQANFMYRTAANKLYPFLSPYADPALDRITHSACYSAVMDHLKPAAIDSRSSLEAGGAWTVCTQC